MTFEYFASFYLNVSHGLRVLVTQSANEAHRHCRIGKITLKQGA